jgi:hypothetical protein
MALRSRLEANFAAICNIGAHSHRLGKPLGSHFCCYLSNSHSFASPREAIGNPLLLLFVVFALIRIALRSQWEATFAAICNMCALGSHWTTTFAAICDIRLQSEAVGKPLLLLCVIFALIRVALRSHWATNFVAICNIRARSHRCAKPLGSHFCCYL